LIIEEEVIAKDVDCFELSSIIIPDPRINFATQD